MTPQGRNPPAAARGGQPFGSPRLAGVVLAATAIASGVGVGPAAAAGDPAAGARVFSDSGCGACHTLAAAKATGRVGPNLDQAKPDVARVVAMVTGGKGAMPSFRGSLTDAQIQDVAAFITQGNTPAPAPTPTTAPPPAQPAGPATAPSPVLGAGPARVRVRIGSAGVSVSPAEVPAGRVRILVTNATRRSRRVVVRRTLRPGESTPADPWIVVVGRSEGLTVGPRRLRGWHLTLAAGRYSVAIQPSNGRRPATGVLDAVAAQTTSIAGPPSSGTTSPPADPARTEPPRPAQPPPPPDGRALFTAICGGCHTLAAAGTVGSVGPNLDRKHPDREEVVETVIEGDDEMPSFAGTLTAQQIDAIAAFVAASVRR